MSNQSLSAAAGLQCGRRWLDLSSPRIMAVLNVTPDSFSDGGSLNDGGRLSLDLALRRVETLLTEGADIIDVGGESTRPGAAEVSVSEEMDRVLPVVEAIAARFDTVISVDTSTPELMRASAAAGAGLINDVRALERQGAVAAAADTGLPICLMHMLGTPQMMQDNPQYEDVVSEVGRYLSLRVDACLTAGIAKERLLLDPGFGFGKTVEHNLQLLKRLSELEPGGYPVLVGLSRKSIIGNVLGRKVDQRLAGSLALAMLAVERGAAIVRVHDVQQTSDVLRLRQAVLGA
jgi:dihydropteroate synthase